MKTNMLILILTTILAITGIISCKDSIITADRLPDAARSFINEYFAENTISYIKKDRGLANISYEVVLQDGTEIEFDKSGNWDSIDCKRNAVPAGLVPDAISEYVQVNFPGQLIVKIDREAFGYEIELSSDLELKFDKNGKMLEIDD
ncbi:MAG: PepSY-like domain-containing protein [Bacteroidales bacterium]|nr:PepSY-like domain-containing protein [Bacteroidales bacterium]